MRRRVLNIACVLSLLLCLATAGLWVRSCYYYDRWAWRWPDGLISPSQRKYACIISWSGILTASNVPKVYRPSFGTYPDWYGSFCFGQISMWSSDFVSLHSHNRPGNSPGISLVAYVVSVPHWFIVLLFAVLPTVRLRLLTKRHRPGTCRTCGYDLRATPTRCPECGTIPETILAIEKSG